MVHIKDFKIVILEDVWDRMLYHLHAKNIFVVEDHTHRLRQGIAIGAHTSSLFL